MKGTRFTAALAAALLAAIGPGRAAPDCELAHAPAVPVVLNLPYTAARSAILADGWAPRPGRPHNGLSSNESSFRERGFNELQFCRMDAQSLCRFAFASPAGVTLWLTTQGDENPALATQAVVSAAKLACSKDPDPG